MVNVGELRAFTTCPAMDATTTIKDPAVVEDRVALCAVPESEELSFGLAITA